MSKFEKTFENQILNTPADKVHVARQLYEECTGSILIDQTLQHKFLKHVSAPILVELNEFLCTSLSRSQICNAVCVLKNDKTLDSDDVSGKSYLENLAR